MKQGMASGVGNCEVSGFGYANYGSKVVKCSDKALVHSYIVVYYVSRRDQMTHSRIHSRCDGFVKP